MMFNDFLKMILNHCILRQSLGIFYKQIFFIKMSSFLQTFQRLPGCLSSAAMITELRYINNIFLSLFLSFNLVPV